VLPRLTAAAQVNSGDNRKQEDEGVRAGEGEPRRRKRASSTGAGELGGDRDRRRSAQTNGEGELVGEERSRSRPRKLVRERDSRTGPKGLRGRRRWSARVAPAAEARVGRGRRQGRGREGGRYGWAGEIFLKPNPYSLTYILTAYIHTRIYITYSHIHIYIHT
jgi:hypothetical protein